MEYDFATYGPDGRLTLVIEAKRRQGTDSDWARQLRRNRLAHSQLPSSTLFTVIVPDRLFVWGPNAPIDANPEFEIDARELLAPYFERAHIDPRTIAPEAFELLVGWWLDDLSRRSAATPNPTLAASGLLEAIAGGRVVHLAAA